MKRYKLPEDQPDFGGRSPLTNVDDETRTSVRAILSDVRERGWEGVNERSLEFDDVEPDSRPVSPGHLDDCWAELEPDQRKALEFAAQRIKRFQGAFTERSKLLSDTEGGAVGQVVRPVQRVGCYVPGGRVPLPSTVLMTALVAEVAGVPEILLCSPPQSDGRPHPGILAAASLVDGLSVRGIGGVQAIGTMAYGAGPVDPVDVIVGPGNLFVTLAKKEVFGDVGVDLLAGPSEIAVVAEPDSTEPGWVAADLISQAEHDPRSRSYLFTTSTEFASTVEGELDRQVSDHPRPKPLRQALEPSAIILGETIDQLLEQVDRLAPEHLELHLSNPERWAREVNHAGAIFLGPYSPEPIGDYVAGPNHTLPTGGSARFFSPLSVRTFQRRQSLIKTTEAGLEELSPHAAKIARMESLPGHRNSARAREETS